MFSTRTLVGRWPLALLMVLLSAPLLRANAIDHLSSPRFEVSLEGTWTVQGLGAVTVPTQIPRSGGITIWTRTFTLSMANRPKVAYLHFEGIVHTADVKLNGISVGKLVALTDSRLDVAAAVNYNGANQLELDIDDRLQETTVPGGPIDLFLNQYGSDAYTFPIAFIWDPGIVRNVSLVASNHAVITDVFVLTTFDDTLSWANVNVRLRVIGEAAQNLTSSVSLSIAGVLKGDCYGVPAAADELVCNIPVSSPVLWSPTNPNLYDLSVQLFDTAGVADIVVDRVGLRKLEVRGNRFYLNNNPVFLRGISRHDMYPGSELVANDSIIDYDLRTIKGFGVNFIRTIHYPPDARFAKRADEIGMLISEEIPAWATVSEPTVVQIAQGMVQSMIERDMNRASVILWLTGSGSNRNGAIYLAATAATAKGVDPLRPVSFVFDDAPSQVNQIIQNANAMRAAGMSIYAQNAYWPPWAMQAFIPMMPSDMPTLFTEWTGSEGSNKGPLGTPGVGVFPAFFSSDGNSSEELSAQRMVENFSGVLPYACSANQTSPCISGMVYFTWQDILWPSMWFWSPGHLPVLRTGLVYEDRTWKNWPIGIFLYLMELLPR